LCSEVSDEIHSAIPVAVRLRRAGSVQPRHDRGHERRHRRPELRRDVPGVHGGRHVPGPVPAAGVAMTDIDLDSYCSQLQGDSAILLSRFPDKSVDLILTDPEYDMDESTKNLFHNHFLRISRQWIIVFMPPENTWILPANQYLFWVKPISTKNTSKSYSRFVEQIFIYGHGTWNNDRHWSQYTNVFMDLVDDTKGHRHRKPPSLIERLIRNHTSEGDLILDPFCGSGVVGQVGKILNRRVITIDKNASNTIIGI